MNRRGQYNLARDYVRHVMAVGTRTNAFDLALLLRKEYDVGVDWHECSQALDNHVGVDVVRVGHTTGGAIIYRKEPQ